MADEKQVGRPRGSRSGSPIDRGLALMRDMDNETLRDYAAVVRGFAAARLSNGAAPTQSMLELGMRAAEGEE